MAQAAMRRISEDLAAAFASQDGPFRGENEVEDGRRVDRLRFCSLAHLVFNPDKQQPGPALIGYRLEKEDGEDRKYRLLRSDQPLLPGQEAEDEKMNPPAFVLADNLRSFQCTYFDRQGQEFYSWQVEVEENNSEKKRKLPAAVHCILEFWLMRIWRQRKCSAPGLSCRWGPMARTDFLCGNQAGLALVMTLLIIIFLVTMTLQLMMTADQQVTVAASQRNRFAWMAWSWVV
jgi:hypothetical protein